MKKILLTTVAVAAFAQGASALEAGKMYARADLGYNFSSPKLNEKIAKGKDNTTALFSKTSQSNRLKGFAGDIGFGYALSDSIRTDVTINMSQGKKKLKDVEFGASKKLGSITNGIKVASATDMTISTGSTGVTLKNTVNLKEKKLGLMANAYYDFNNASEFTPYVMSGVGVSRSSLEAKVNGYKSDGAATPKAVAASETIKSKNLTSLAYQVGVGVGYEVAKDISLDVGYKMSGMTGSYKFKAADLAATATGTPAGILDGNGLDKEFAKSKLQHTLTAGVRFAF